MNWLMYIGGGALFAYLVRGIIKKLWGKVDQTDAIIVIAVWIWICWRFIR